MKNVLLLGVAASLACYADVTVTTKRLGSMKASESVVIGVTGGGGGDISPAIAYTTAVSNKVEGAIAYTTAVSNKMEVADADRYTKSEADGRFVASVGGKVAFANVTNAYGDAVNGSDIKMIAGSGDSIATYVNALDNLKANRATTLSGYGITDAKIHNGTITLGTQTITPLTQASAEDNFYKKANSVTIDYSGIVFSDGGSVEIGNLGLSVNSGSLIKKDGKEVVYGISTNGTDYLHADVNLKPWGDGILSQARADSQSMVGGISNKLEYIEGYMAGQRVRISVTNYYGNTSGDIPRLRIEEFITATNLVDGVDVETNYWQIVWDENNKYQQFYTNTTIAVSGMTNDLYQTYYELLQERLNAKAPRAWGTLTSAGEAAPVGTVWHTEPNTVFAGGTEYAHAMVGTGVIGVLTSRGAAIYTDGETGRFHFTTDDKTHYFGMNIASRYELGCYTDGITVTQVGGNNMVEILYNVTMSGKPILYYTPTLTNAWSQITDSTGAAIPGAPVYASWEQSPPAGSEICNINGGTGLFGFFKAGIEYAGTSKFETNMMADLAGGIIATNQTTNQMQPVEPYISNGQVLWRIKQ